VVYYFDNMIIMKLLKLAILFIISIIITSCEIEPTNYCEDDIVNNSKVDSNIVFISWRTPNSEEFSLCSMNLDGSQQKILTNLIVRCEKPVISHSGKTVLFVHPSPDGFYELYSISVDGSNLSLIDRASRYCGSPDWSIDDSKIIYSKNRNESTDERDIILLDLNTNNKITLTDTFNNLLARFSKDDKIAVWKQEDNSNYVFILNSDGSNKQDILANAKNPVWSPGGKRIAYVSNIFYSGTGFFGSPQIFVACFDGSNPIQLTNTFLPSTDAGKPAPGNDNPVWTPDGEKIVFESKINDGLPEIYIMDSNGTNQLRLTDTDGRNEQPEISSDSKKIYFTSTRDPDYTFDIYVMSIDGRNQDALTLFPGYDCNPVIIRK